MLKQIDFKTALELAGKGCEVKVMIPAGQDCVWDAYMPDTLQNMLEGCLFFGDEMKERNQCTPSGNTTVFDGGEVRGVSKRKNAVDTGKILALRKAGWTMKAIAEELKISEATVFNHLKRNAVSD